MLNKLYVFLILGLLFFIYSCNQDSSDSNEDLVKRYKNELNSMIIHSYDEIVIENDYISDSVFVVNTKFDTLNFKDLLGDKPKVFFHYSDKECSACLQVQFELLKQFQDSLGSENVIILANVSSLRQPSVVFRQFKLRFPIYQIINHGLLTMTQVEIRNPYYFISSKDNIIKNVHIPDKGFPELTMHYFRTIIYRRLI